jgi:hypothetical protein
MLKIGRGTRRRDTDKIYGRPRAGFITEDIFVAISRGYIMP